MEIDYKNLKEYISFHQAKNLVKQNMRENIKMNYILMNKGSQSWQKNSTIGF